MLTINKSWRISESNLICIAIIGGSVGIIGGMNTFRHKTKHNKFSIGGPGIMFLQVLLFLSLDENHRNYCLQLFSHF